MTYFKSALVGIFALIAIAGITLFDCTLLIFHCISFLEGKHCIRPR